MCYVFITIPNHRQLKDGLIKILLTIKVGKKNPETFFPKVILFPVAKIDS